MCGFVGYITPKSNNIDHNKVLSSMLDAIFHRGPDSSGMWVKDSVALGHRRLSIHDLSSLGHQPMVSNSERYVIVFNGEIYNFERIRSTLTKHGVIFRSNSDTEVILAAVEKWGIKASLQKLIGMFAFAIWDNKEKKLTIARDRIGEKPLYYGFSGNSFVFSSQLSSFLHYPKFSRELNKEAIALYLTHNYIPSPYSIYKGICKLEPAKYIEATLNNDECELSEPKSYWELKDFSNPENKDNRYLDPNKALSELDELISDSVLIQSKADVPVGAFLSGGIDSTLVAAKMQSLSQEKVNTFTIGFNDKKYNEAIFAKDIAKYLGTEHTELYIGESELLDIVPNLSNIYDEPFADSSQIPTVIVGQLARKKVTVSLSGDGGDELFCGYSRYFKTQERWNKLNKVPKLIRNMASSISNELPASFSSKRLFALSRNMNKDLQRSIDYLGCSDFRHFYRRNISSMLKPEQLVNSARRAETKYSDLQIAGISNLEHMMYTDTKQYLPDDILVKVDRAFMSSSLEGRIPLLDHRIVEFSWKVPISTHCYDGKGKYLLRRLLEKHVPVKYTNRSKMGFGVPLAEWLRGPLLDWCEDLLSEERLLSDNVFDHSFVREIWSQHKLGQSDWSSLLWSILMFNMWYELQK